MNNMMTLLITKLFGKKAGEDHLGNKYFYRLVKNNKEKRWVIYKGEPDGSSVPSHWQAWLTRTVNSIPINKKKYKWQKKHVPNLTGSQDAYNSLENIFDNNLKKKHTAYSSWNPNSKEVNKIDDKK